MSKGHFIFNFEFGASCSCGQTFDTALDALDHALPLNARDLADRVAADPTATPKQVADSEELARESAAIANRARS